MAKRDNHYESAFEAFLRTCSVPYVAVDETRRSLTTPGDSVKNVDFLVSPESPPCWLVDVKGRRFPGGRKHKQYWRNWSTEDDLVGLTRWENFLGGDFKGLLVFAYEVVGDVAPLPREDLFTHRERLYAFLGVAVDEYRRRARMISPRWRTVALSTREFREVAQPMQMLLGVETVARVAGA